jgi:hypothetical protein
MAMPATLRAQELRLKLMEGPDWVPNMIRALYGEQWFRWFDGGDLASVDHLARIVEIAEGTPDCMHWLPTREIWMISRFLKDGGRFPSNLRVRVSAAMIDGKPPAGHPYTSTVHKDKRHRGHACKAHLQDGQCQDCRVCWSTRANVSYPAH